MFTCRDAKGGELSSQASKMLYKLPGAVYIASYRVPLDQSDCRKLFVQLLNYTKAHCNSCSFAAADRPPNVSRDIDSFESFKAHFFPLENS